MAKFAGRRFVTPATIETQVFDWGTIKWLSEPRVTGTDRFTMGVVLLQPGNRGDSVRCLRAGQPDDRYRRRAVETNHRRRSGPHSRRYLPLNGKYRLGIIEIDCRLFSAGARSPSSRHGRVPGDCAGRVTGDLAR
jgi:hypothetical protein